MDNYGNYGQECQDYSVGLEESFQQWFWDTRYSYAKNQTNKNKVGPLFHTICKN